MPDDAGVHGYTPLSLRPRPEAPQWLCDATLVTKKYMFFLFALYVLFDSMMTSDWIRKPLHGSPPNIEV
jgi:hypothetical protein